jgi:hypothetical protein
MASLNIDIKDKSEKRVDESSSSQEANAQTVIRLIDEWLADESGYDEQNWHKIKNLLEENHTSDRAIFDE